MLIYESHVYFSNGSHGFRLIPVMGIDLHTPAMLISEYNTRISPPQHGKQLYRRTTPSTYHFINKIINNICMSVHHDHQQHQHEHVIIFHYQQHYHHHQHHHHEHHHVISCRHHQQHHHHRHANVFISLPHRQDPPNPASEGFDHRHLAIETCKQIRMTDPWDAGSIYLHC